MVLKTKNIMKVTCYLGKEKLCDLDWDEMPNVGMGFSYEKKQYMIIGINGSKIKLKDITPIGSKKK